MYRRYLAIVTLVLALCLPPLAASWLYLRNSGELTDMETLAAQQAASREFCLVGTALHEDLYHYKLALYRAYKPDVIALGSSRMLQFRSAYFRGSFLNMGSSLREISTGEHLLSAMLSVHKPKLILLGVDYWWFNDRVEKPGRAEPPRRRPLVLDIRKLLMPYAWMREGKVRPARFFTGLNPWRSASGRCRMGVRAYEEEGGFGPDGSNYYLGTVSGTRTRIYDRRFADTLGEIHEGNSRLSHGQHANATHLAMFRDFVQSVHDAGIELVLIFPPHAPRIVQEMAGMGDAYAYIDDLRNQLRKAGIAFHDFQDPAALGTTDCEFYDGSHPGDIVDARILRALVQAGERELAANVNLEAVESAINRYAGLAMLPDPRALTGPEADFLGLGCPGKRH